MVKVSLAMHILDSVDDPVPVVGELSCVYYFKFLMLQEVSEVLYFPRIVLILNID